MLLTFHDSVYNLNPRYGMTFETYGGISLVLVGENMGKQYEQGACPYQHANVQVTAGLLPNWGCADGPRKPHGGD